MYNATHVRDNELHDRKQVGQNPADSSCERRAALFTVWMKRPASVHADVCSHPHCLQPLNIILPSLPSREAGHDLKSLFLPRNVMRCTTEAQRSMCEPFCPAVNEGGKNLFHCSLKSWRLSEFSSERRSTLVRNINSETHPSWNWLISSQTGSIYTYTPDIWLNAS